MGEKRIEEDLITQLEGMGYTYRREIKTLKKLEENFIEKLELLNGLSFTASEEQRVRRDILMKPSFEAIEAVDLWESGYLLEREDGERVVIQLQKPGENEYEVINQLRVDHRPGVETTGTHNVFDVNILVNGIPLMIIELKRPGLKKRGEVTPLMQAHRQINRYRRESFRNILHFQRVCLISDGVNTRYYANDTQEGDIGWENVFYWADRENKVKKELRDVVGDMLKRDNFEVLINEYLIDTRYRRYILRPYQIYAFQGAIERVKSGESGFIWHSTGAGKTLLLHQIGSRLSKAGKQVILLVDRQDLDSQTAAEFEKFGRKEEFTTTASTRELVEVVQRGDRFVLTTIQKFSRMLGKPSNFQGVDKENIVILVDECHRSVFGKMFKRIRGVLNEPIRIGVTGTPIFPDNRSKNEQVTADLFGEVVHEYKMLEAVRDKNILTLSVSEYKLDWEEDKAGVVREIIKMDRSLTNKGEFVSLFTTRNIKTLLEYQKEFKRQGKEVATIFSLDEDEEKRQALDEIIKDYNKRYNTSYSLETVKEYTKDVQEKLLTGEVEMVLVVDMLLTGYDNKQLNTIYLARKLEGHTLIQAVSRVNRLKKGKEHGNVVLIADIREELDSALEKYNKIRNTSELLVRPYKERLGDYKAAVSSLLAYTPTYKEANTLEGDESKKVFLRLFRAVSKTKKWVETEPLFEMDKSVKGMTGEDYSYFQSVYSGMELDNEDIRDYKDQEIEEFEYSMPQGFIVDTDYLVRLVGGLIVEHKEYVNEQMDIVIDLKNILTKKGLQKEIAEGVQENIDKVEADIGYKRRELEARLELEVNKASLSKEERAIYKRVYKETLDENLETLGGLEEIVEYIQLRVEEELENQQNSELEAIYTINKEITRECIDSWIRSKRRGVDIGGQIKTYYLQNPLKDGWIQEIKELVEKITNYVEKEM